MINIDKGSQKFIFNVAPMVALVLGLMATTTLFIVSHKNLDDIAQVRFENGAGDMQNLVSQRLELYGSALYGAQGLFAASKSVEADEWASYVHKLSLKGRFPGISAFRYIERHKQDFLSEDQYFIKYVEPVSDANKEMVGKQIIMDAPRRLAFERARNTGEISMVAKLDLAQNETNTRMFGICLPVYNNLRLSLTLDEKRESLEGFVDVVFNSRELFQNIFSNMAVKQRIDFEIFDTSKLFTGSLVYDDNPDFDAVFPKYKPRFSLKRPLVVAGETWILYFTSLPEYVLDNFEGSTPWLVLFSGLLASLILFKTMNEFSNSRLQALNLAENIDESLRTEVTKNQQNEKELWRLNELRKAMLDGAGYGIISTDKDGIVQTFNKAAEKMLGYSREEVVGLCTPGIFHDPKEITQRAVELSKELGRPVQVGFEVFIAKALQNKTDEREWTYVRKDGLRFPVRLSVSVLHDEKGNITGFLGIASDITEQKQAHEKIMEVVRIKSEFVSTVSHELRTPLTVIKEAVSIVQDGDAGDINDEQKDFLQTARKNIDRLSRLINNVLDYQKLESQNREMNIAEADLVSLCEEVKSGFDMLAKNKGLDLIFERPEKKFIRAFYDKDKITQVITNFLSNAIKFTSKGKILFGLTLENQAVRFWVTDQGLGILPEDRKKLFTSFTQLSSGGSRETGGTGLGLAISKKIIEMHHGNIGVDSVFGQGTTFYFVIPLRGDWKISQ